MMEQKHKQVGDEHTERALNGNNPIPIDRTVKSYTDAKSGVDMIRIPAGEFIYGEERRIEYLEDFWISKTPVTNVHYFRFVSAVDHRQPRLWKDKPPMAEIADHPVAYVSWYDAAAFAAWAGMRLPSEEEWEKASRGTDGREFPWGKEWRDGQCNTREAGVYGTTPAGHYSPQGDSSYGCVDMAGNVWEWTTSWYDDTEKHRVHRGGYWYATRAFERTTFRSSGFPVNTHDSISGLGFRVIVRPT